MWLKKRRREKPPKKSGAAEGIRTPDLRGAGRVLRLRISPLILVGALTGF